MASKHQWTIRFAILTPVLLFICILLMGAGHGTYTPAMVLFPWGTLNTVWQDHLSQPFVIAGILQFIVYGFVIDKTHGTKSRRFVLACIILSHILLTIMILVLRDPMWK